MEGLNTWITPNQLDYPKPEGKKEDKEVRRIVLLGHL
jgi:hypothetical protein